MNCRTLVLFGTLFLHVCVCGISWGDVIQFGGDEDAFEIEFVRIESLGNAPDVMSVPGGPIEGDPRDQLGAVDYPYLIGKHEISRDNIIKVDAASAIDGTGGNLNLSMFMDAIGGAYSSPDQPANTTWIDAARFVNWLNTSTGLPPPTDFVCNQGMTSMSTP